MEPTLERRFLEYEKSPTTWDPIKGGKRAWVCFDDSITVGWDVMPSEASISAVIERMMGGNYYPPDAVQFFGRFRDEKRHLKTGERILQRARMLPFVDGLYLYSMAEIFVAESGPRYCKIGYVTTKRHFGRGIWSATLSEENGKLQLKVESTASPGSWQFWVGLPVARFLQLRARRRGIQDIFAMVAKLEAS